MRETFMIASLLLLLLLPGAGALRAAVELVFVRPRNAPEATSLSSVEVLRVRGGRAFAFEAVPPGVDGRVDALRELLAGSRAVAEALALWSRARAVAGPASQRWIEAAEPVPVWVLPAEAPPRGPGLASLLPCRIFGHGDATDASMLLQVADLRLPDGELLAVEELTTSGLLRAMIAHECFHGMQADLMRQDVLRLALEAAPFGNGHDLPETTDRSTAFKEGFAEAGEAFLAGRHADEIHPVLETGRPALRRFAADCRRRRLDRVRRNRYVFASDGRIRDGELDEGAADRSTEGVVASLLLAVIEHGDLVDPWGALFATMATERPVDFFELLAGLERRRPEARATLRRIVLENTYYTVRSVDALALYREAYLAKKAFVQGRLSREESRAAVELWTRWKTRQYEAVMAGSPLDGALPRPLVAMRRDGTGVDLNDDDLERLAWELESFLPAADGETRRRRAEVYAVRIMVARDRLGALSSVEQLGEVLPNRLVDALRAGIERSRRRMDERIDEQVSLRRALHGHGNGETR